MALHYTQDEVARLFSDEELQAMDAFVGSHVERFNELVAKNCTGGGLSDEESAEYESLAAIRQAELHEILAGVRKGSAETVQG